MLAIAIGCGSSPTQLDAGSDDLGAKRRPDARLASDAAAPPSVTAFAATPAELPAGGGPVTLSWSVSGAESIVIDHGVGQVTGSSVLVSVTASTVFTLSASSAAGTTQATVAVTVGSTTSPPRILAFSASPATLPAGGGDTVLQWDVADATTISISGLGPVTGGSVATHVTASTVFTLTAGNAAGSVTATTAVSVGQNPPSSGGRFVAMVAPTHGEAFVAPASLRLVAAGRDPNVFTNEPEPGLGGNAARVQFFVDDDVVLEVEGSQAEYWIFKGFIAGVPAGQHRVWARAIYVNPSLVLDSVPAIVDVAAPPTYAQTVNLTADVVLTGATSYTLAGTAAGRIRLNGNGHRLRTSSGASGSVTLRYVDVYDLGSGGEPSVPGIDVSTTGAVTIEDGVFDGSNALRVHSTSTSLRRNLFRSNMRMPLGQYPDAFQPVGPSYPIAELTGGGAFTGNNVGAGWVVFTGSGWSIEDNVLVGPRVGIYAGADAHVRRNFSHHVYYGGWSQGSNFELDGGPGVVAEHNVVIGSSWPVRGVAGEFRCNLVLEAGHQWLWADHDGGSIHHNLFIGGEGDVGGIYVLYAPQNVRIFNNTFDGQSAFGRAITIQDGSVSLLSNLFLRVPSPGVRIDGGTLTADHNLWFGPAQGYSDGRLPPHDIVGSDPRLAAPVTGPPFNLDEVGVWRRTLTVPDILSIYRSRYAPQAGSPAIDAGDPSGGAGNDIGAVGAGMANANDCFGRP